MIKPTAYNSGYMMALPLATPKFLATLGTSYTRKTLDQKLLSLM
jgi:hypothetical protein